MDSKSRIRTEIGLKLKALREARQFSQVDLAKRLEISQAGLSLIERGKSSLNTEDFLQVLRVFNVPASHFYSDLDKGSSEDVLQNALARLGASHLYENSSLPSEHLEHVNQVIQEVLIDGRNPRHITSLAPVIVAQISQIHLAKLWTDFCNFGMEKRLGWLIENTLEALALTSKPANLIASRNYRQAETTLKHFQGSIALSPKSIPDTSLKDVLGVIAPSEKTRLSIEKECSPISDRWQILSPLHVHDFVNALKASHGAA